MTEIFSSRVAVFKNNTSKTETAKHKRFSESTTLNLSIHAYIHICKYTERTQGSISLLRHEVSYLTVGRKSGAIVSKPCISKRLPALSHFPDLL